MTLQFPSLSYTFFLALSLALPSPLPHPVTLNMCQTLYQELFCGRGCAWYAAPKLLGAACAGASSTAVFAGAGAAPLPLLSACSRAQASYLRL